MRDHETIDRRDALLLAVARVGELLADDASRGERVDRVLAAVGAATGVDRTYAFAVDGHGDELVATQRWEWAAPGVIPQIDNPELQDVPFAAAGFGRWADVLSAGGTIDGPVDEFPAAEQDLLVPQGIAALAVVPLTVRGRWWGFAGFDLAQRRPFSESELAALRTVAGMLGTTISQEELVEELRESRHDYARAYQRERAVTDRLRELDRMKATFLDAVSHELRTPLTSVLGMSRTILAHFDELDRDSHRHLVERLARNADRLDAVLERLLDLNRLRRGGQEVLPTEVELAPFVDEVLATLPEAARRRVTARTVGERAHFDPSVGEHVLVDLVENALVHTPADCRVWITARSTETGGVELTVDDDGPGVDASRVAEVFSPFGHGGDLRPDEPRAGVGLSLVRGLAELHGGRAWYEDREGGGASFRVLLEGASGRPDLSPA